MLCETQEVLKSLIGIVGMKKPVATLLNYLVMYLSNIKHIICTI